MDAAKSDRDALEGIGCALARLILRDELLGASGFGLVFFEHGVFKSPLRNPRYHLPSTAIGSYADIFGAFLGVLFIDPNTVKIAVIADLTRNPTEH